MSASMVNVDSSFPTQVFLASASAAAAESTATQAITRAAIVEEDAASASSSDVLVLTLSLPSADADAIQSALDKATAADTAMTATTTAASASRTAKVNIIGDFTFTVAESSSSSSSVLDSVDASATNTSGTQTDADATASSSASASLAASSAASASSSNDASASSTATTSESADQATSTNSSNPPSASSSSTRSRQSTSTITRTNVVTATRSVANLGSTQVKVVGTQIVFTGLSSTLASTTLPSSTSTSTASQPSDKNGLYDFLHSLGSSGSSIALTVIVCLAIFALICAAIAFCIRRARRRERRGVMKLQYDQSVGKYSDLDSAYSQMESLNRVSQAYSNHGNSIRSVQPASFPQIPQIQYEDYDEKEGHQQHPQSEWYFQNDPASRRPSSMEASVIMQLLANVPSLHTPTSVKHQFDEGPSATVASSPYLEPAIDEPLRRTYLGSFSASVPDPQSFVHGPSGLSRSLDLEAAERSPSLLSPPRPNRPSSLTSSFKIAVDEHLAENPESMVPPAVARSMSQSPSVTTPPSPTPQSAWGVKTISQVFSASTNAVKGLLSPAAPSVHSPSYDEEKADMFTALPLPTDFPRRMSSRWGSFASQGNNLVSADRKGPQPPMASRFSITTLDPNSPTPSSASGSVYQDWQLRSALRTNMAVPRAAPQLIAQREPTPTGSEKSVKSADSDRTLTDRDTASPAVHQVDMARSDTGHASVETASTNPFAFTAPLSTPLQRPILPRTISNGESIFSHHDPEDDAWEMTAEEQEAMTELIRKRRQAAMKVR